MSNLSLSLRIAAIFIIWTASAAGVCWPFLIEAAVSTDSPFFKCLKACAAGVMLGIALMHLLPEANEVLESVCPDYSLAFAVTAGGVILNLALEQITMIWLTAKKKEKEMEMKNISSVPNSIDKTKSIDMNVEHAQTCKTPGCVHDLEGGLKGSPLTITDDEKNGPATPSAVADRSNNNSGDNGTCGSTNGDGDGNGNGKSNEQHLNRRRRRSVEQQIADEIVEEDGEEEILSSLMDSTSLKDLIALYAMELSISVHSIIIGVEIGLAAGSSELPTLIALLVAIAFHQFVEGSGLGTILRTMQSAAGSTKVIVFVILFALTTPLGIFIGIMTSGLPDSPSQEAAKGIAGSLACGSLLYISLTEMVATYFNAENLIDRPKLKLQMIGTFTLGVAIMAIIAIWA